MEEVKLYFDFKSPSAFLAKDPAFDLPGRSDVCVRWIPSMLRLFGKRERSNCSESNARYSSMDALRWANRRGKFPIERTLKIEDSVPSLVGGLYSMRGGFLRQHADPAARTGASR